MPYADKEKQQTYQREWARKNRHKQRNYMRRVRTEILDMLGGRCVHCGCDIQEALEINHIQGGGAKEQREYTSGRSKHKKGGRKGFYIDILKGRRTTKDLELTCKICNAHHQLTCLKSIEDNWVITWTPKN